MFRILIAASLLLAGCSQPNDAELIQKQLELYANYTRTMNHFGVASLFAEDGLLEPAARGPKAIQQQLATTASLKVMEFAIDPAKPAIHGDEAEQVVVYQKQLRTPQGNTAQLTGSLKFRWKRVESGRWVISNLATLATSSAPPQ